MLQNQTREDLITMVAHDLKNFLTSLNLNAKLLDKMLEKCENPCAFQMKVVKNIERISTNMNQFVHQALDTEKLKYGYISKTLSAVAPSDLLDQARRLSFEWCNTKEIFINIEDRSEGKLVSCDQSQVIRVFSNLLENAVKFSNEGSQITIGAIAKEEEVMFFVKDEGSGIREEQKNQIFCKYWQEDDSAKTGNGLGLWIAKNIVEANGGKIWVESQPGFGSQFFFTLSIAN